MRSTPPVQRYVHRPQAVRRLMACLTATLTALALIPALGGCPAHSQSPSDMNSTDPTNNGAAYVGASSCRQCHADIAAKHALTGHANALTPILGAAPIFPPAASRAAVPDPPADYAWANIAYLIDGYLKAALYIDTDGYILTTGLTGKDTQWNLSYPADGTTAGFAPFAPQAATPLSFDYARFAARTTGPVPFNPSAPQYQENRPGIPGTWSEAGAQCEACHGPGGMHFSTTNGQVIIDTSKIYVDPSGAQTCARCHSQPYAAKTSEILANGGFIVDQQQWTELKASGGHSSFACTVCHDPHRSVTYDRAAAIRNECRVCHGDVSMAGHGGKVFIRGDYSEPVTCESCHMTFATRTATSAPPSVVGPLGHMADTRTHIFRVNVTATSSAAMFTANGAQVVRDSEGRAAVTIDFVCLRCHNEQGVFTLTPARAAEIAGEIHTLE